MKVFKKTRNKINQAREDLLQASQSAVEGLRSLQKVATGIFVLQMGFNALVALCLFLIII